MGQAKVTERIEATADAVWEMFRHFDGVKRYRPALESCEVEGSGIGAVRTLVFPGGIVVKERLEKFDDTGRSFGYSMLSGVPAKDCQVLVEVKAAGEACEVIWSSTFEAVGLPDEKLSTIFEDVYRSGLQGIRNLLCG